MAGGRPQRIRVFPFRVGTRRAALLFGGFMNQGLAGLITFVAFVGAIWLLFSGLNK
jgi:hypothetical protein